MKIRERITLMKAIQQSQKQPIRNIYDDNFNFFPINKCHSNIYIIRKKVVRERATRNIGPGRGPDFLRMKYMDFICFIYRSQLANCMHCKNRSNAEHFVVDHSQITIQFNSILFCIKSLLQDYYKKMV
jgi:hypothetical protein